MSLPSLQQVCSKNLYENCDNIDDIYNNELISNPVKKTILNAGEWYCTEKIDKYRKQYEFGKTHEQELKIHRISVNIFNISVNQRLEFSVDTHLSDVYLAIIRNAQESNKSQYLFDSLWHEFPKDNNDFCTVEAVQSLRSRMGSDRFDRTYLYRSLFCSSKFNTQEELIKKINEVCAILQQSDSSTEAITKYLKLDFKV